MAEPAIAEEVELAAAVHRWFAAIVRALEHGDELQLSLSPAGERVEERLGAIWPELQRAVRSFVAAFVEHANLSVRTKAVDALSDAVADYLAMIPRDAAAKPATKGLAIDFAASAEAMIRIIEVRHPDYPPLTFSYPCLLYTSPSPRD